MKTIYNHIPGLPLKNVSKYYYIRGLSRPEFKHFLGESNFPQGTEILYLVFGVIGKYHAIKRPQELGSRWTVERGLEFSRLTFVCELSARFGDELRSFVGFSGLSVQGLPVS